MDRIEQIKKNFINMLKERVNPSPELQKIITEEYPGESEERVRELRSNMYLYHFKKKYEWFYKEAETLFSMILDGKFDDPNDTETLDFLKKLFGKAELVAKGVLDIKKENENIGQELYDIYVKPLVPKMKKKNPDEPQILIDGNSVEVSEEEIRKML